MLRTSLIVLALLYNVVASYAAPCDNAVSYALAQKAYKAMQQNRYDSALYGFIKATEYACPNYTSIQHNALSAIAEMYFKAEQYEKSVDYYMKALANAQNNIDSSTVYLNIALAAIYYDASLASRSLKLIQKPTPTYYITYSLFLESENKFEAIIKLIKPQLKHLTGEDSLILANTFAHAHAQTGKEGAAQDIWRALLENNQIPSELRIAVLQNLGRTEEKQGNITSARKYYVELLNQKADRRFDTYKVYALKRLILLDTDEENQKSYQEVLEAMVPAESLRQQGISNLRQSMLKSGQTWLDLEKITAKEARVQSQLRWLIGGLALLVSLLGVYLFFGIWTARRALGHLNSK